MGSAELSLWDTLVAAKWRIDNDPTNSTEIQVGFPSEESVNRWEKSLPILDGLVQEPNKLDFDSLFQTGWKKILEGDEAAREESIEQLKFSSRFQSQFADIGLSAGDFVRIWAWSFAAGLTEMGDGLRKMHARRELEKSQAEYQKYESLINDGWLPPSDFLSKKLVGDKNPSPVVTEEKTSPVIPDEEEILPVVPDDEFLTYVGIADRVTGAGHEVAANTIRNKSKKLFGQRDQKRGNAHLFSWNRIKPILEEEYSVKL